MAGSDRGKEGREMVYLGAHMSSAGGYAKMAERAAEIGSDTCQFFCRNPRGSRAKPLDREDLARCREIFLSRGFGPVIGHAPYIMNPCAKDPGIRELAGRMMAEDLALLEHLTPGYYVFHPGSHVGQGMEEGCRLIAEMLNRSVPPGGQTTVLLETMTGKGTEIGGRFQDLRMILDRLEDPVRDRVGVCLDTCHMSDAGYDVAEDLDGVLAELDRTVGLHRVKAAHINDSLNPRGARKDRHAALGEGTLGLPAILRFLTHPAIQGLPCVLETPWDDEGHGKELALLRENLT